MIIRRVLAGAVAILCGLAAAFVVGWQSLGGGEQRDALGWTIILSIFAAPVLFYVLAGGLFVLELGAALLPRWRVAILLLGVVVVPLLAQILIGGMWMRHSDQTDALTRGAPGFMLLPSLVMCTVQLLLTVNWWEVLNGAAPPPAQSAPPPPKPREPGPFTPIVLKTPPASARIMEILTSPRERIGQHLFMYALQLWGLAATLWFSAPFVLGALFDLPQDLRLALAFWGWFVLIWAAFCATANRMHDIGLSAVWGAAPAALAVLLVVREGPPDTGWASMTTIVYAVTSIVVCYGLTAAFLLTRKGDPLGNRYGPAPDEA